MELFFREGCIVWFFVITGKNLYFYFIWLSYNVVSHDLKCFTKDTVGFNKAFEFHSQRRWKEAGEVFW